MRASRLSSNRTTRPRRHVEATREMAATVTAELGRESRSTGFPRSNAKSSSIACANRSGLAPAAATRVPGVRFRRWVPLAASIAASIAIVVRSMAFLLPRLFPPQPPCRLATDQQPNRTTASAGRRSRTQAVQQTLPDTGTRKTSRFPARWSRPGSTTPTTRSGSRSRACRTPSRRLDAVPHSQPEPAARRDAAAGVLRRTPETAAAAEARAPVRWPTAGLGPARSPEAEDVRRRHEQTQPHPSPPAPGKRGPRTVNVSPPRDPQAFDKIVKSGADATDNKPRVYENPFRKAADSGRGRGSPLRVDTIVVLGRPQQPARTAFAPRPTACGSKSWSTATPIATRRRPRAARRWRSASRSRPARGTSTTAWPASRSRPATAARRSSPAASKPSVEFNPLATTAWRLIGYENEPVPPASRPTASPWTSTPATPRRRSTRSSPCSAGDPGARDGRRPVHGHRPLPRPADGAAQQLREPPPTPATASTAPAKISASPRQWPRSACSSATRTSRAPRPTPT